MIQGFVSVGFTFSAIWRACKIAATLGFLLAAPAGEPVVWYNGDPRAGTAERDLLIDQAVVADVIVIMGISRLADAESVLTVS